LPAGTYQVLADDDYNNNNMIYAGSNVAALGNIYRWIIGESTTWDSLSNRTQAGAPAAAAIVDLGMENGVLYGMAVGGCDRNVYPMIPSGIVAMFWNDMVTGTPAAVVSFATAGGGSNVLYAADNPAGVPTLYAYNDVFGTGIPTLTSPGDGASVGVDPVTGRADMVTLAWSSLGTGAAMGSLAEVDIKKKDEPWGSCTVNAPVILVDPSGPNLTMGPVGTGATWNYAMSANTEYEWRVAFIQAISGDPVRTRYSEPSTIKVMGGTPVQQTYTGPVILGPAGGATTPLKPGISWAAVPGATQYELILATDSGLTSPIAGTPALVTESAWQPATDLDYGTVYFFGIRAVEPTVGVQNIGTFTTMTEPVEAVPPVVIETVPAPVIEIPPAEAPAAPIAPAYIWAIVIIGAILVIAVVVLIVRTRRPL